MRVLVTGATGQLGGYVLDELAASGAEVVAWSGTRSGTCRGAALDAVDLADPGRVTEAFRRAAPAAVIHAAAMASIAQCHREPDRAALVNTGGTALLAELSAAARARLVVVSTDLVFDGANPPYREPDRPNPLSVYGRTKAEAEAAALGSPRAAVVRLSLLFGPTRTGRVSFFDQQLDALRAHRPFTLFHDEWRTPLSLATAARALVTLVRSDHAGLLHVGGPERMSRFEMGRRLATALGVDPTNIVAVSRATAGGPEPRPRDTSLDSSLWRALFPAIPWPAWEEAIASMGLAA